MAKNKEKSIADTYEEIVSKANSLVSRRYAHLEGVAELKKLLNELAWTERPAVKQQRNAWRQRAINAVVGGSLAVIRARIASDKADRLKRFDPEGLGLKVLRETRSLLKATKNPRLTMVQAFYLGLDALRLIELADLVEEADELNRSIRPRVKKFQARLYDRAQRNLMDALNTRTRVWERIRSAQWSRKDFQDVADTLENMFPSEDEEDDPHRLRAKLTEAATNALSTRKARGADAGRKSKTTKAFEALVTSA